MREFDRLINEIRKKKLKAVYFLDGDELYLKDRIVEELRKSLKEKSGCEVNIVIYHSDDVGNEELHSALSEASLFGRNLVVGVYSERK